MRPEQQEKNLGWATIDPAEDVVAGRPYHWRITFTAGPKGVATGGCVRFEIPYGFTPPQTVFPMAVGFTTAHASNPSVGVSLHLQDPSKIDARPGTWGFYVYVQIDGEPLKPGETVSVNYGKGNGKGHTNEGAFAQYFEGEAEFTVAVDPLGDRAAPHGGFLLIDTPQPTIRVVGDTATQLFVAVPSIVRPNEPFAVKLTARNHEQNTDAGFSGPIQISTADTKTWQHIFTSESRGHAAIPNVSVSGYGVQHVTAEAESGSPKGDSNPCLCIQDSEQPRLFWGDIHVMTRISAGLSRPRETYAYARDISHLDFCALTDGDHGDGYFTDEEWEETREAVRQHHEPGRFVTLLASEYHERKVAGDKNIYYREGDGELLRWSDLDGEQPQALWRALEGKRALTIPHHPVSGSARMRPWDHHHPDFQRLVEIYSIWGNSECEGCLRPNYWRNNFDNSVQRGLAKGYRLGFVASGDSHDGLPGNSSWMRLRRGYRGGLVAAFAPALTREAIFDALWDRYCYATTGARIILLFTLNNAPMGSELTGEEARSDRCLRVQVAGTAGIKEIDVIRNGKAVFVCRGQDREGYFEWKDQESFDAVSLRSADGAPFLYYYVRVIQEDGEIAWSSPIWVS